MPGLGFLPAGALALPAVRARRRPGAGRRPPAATAAAAPAAPAAVAPAPAPAAAPAVRYACPRCRSPAAPLAQPACASCGLPFRVSAGFLDLVAPPAGRAARGGGAPARPPRETLFQLPAVSFAYERGWRAQFAAAGFPGVDAEFALLEEFVFGRAGPRAAGGGGDVVIADLSCGSGLMARRMAASGRFRRVVAVDLSAAMLREALARAERAGLSFDVVRADVTRLPFADGALPAVHAGAALHCWGRLQDALAEVHRVTAPGGRFLATTFLKGAYLPDALVGAAADPRLRAAVGGLADRAQAAGRAYRFFDEDELVWLARAAGFTDVSVEARRRCAILRCRKAAA